MSGIVGFVNKSNNKDKIIKDILSSIHHRGPDNEDYTIIDDVALGYCHLKVSTEYSKIIYNEDKNLALCCDGEVNNYEELKKQLEECGHIFKTNSPLEAIVHGYEKWQTKIFKKIRGTFALVIYDKKNNEFICARDGWGSKPLYYYIDDSNFMYSSESKAFLENPNFKKEFNEKILSAYLCFNSIPTEETFFKNVYKLAPGNCIIYKDNSITKEEFFKLEFQAKEKDFNKYVDSIETAVKDSIKVNSREPNIGSFLSSGIDSSFLVSVLKPKETFTISYDSQKYNEETYAKDLTDKLKINNNAVKVDLNNYITDFDKLMYYMDEPLANPSLPAIYLLTKEASKKVKIVFSGEGADELFGGYNSYQEELSMSWYMKIPFIIRRTLSFLVSFFPDVRGLNFIYRRGLKLSDYNIGLGRIFRDKEALSIINSKEQIKNKEIVKPIYEKYKNNSTLEQRQAIDYYFWLVNDFGFAVDRTCSMMSMVGRTPYLDTLVYNSARELPTSAKISKTNTKIALRKAAERNIPNDSYKKKKLGFPVPLREWLKEETLYDKVKETFLSEESKKFFNQKKILKLLEDHKNNKKDNYKKIWTIYSFLIWYREYFIKR